MSSLNRVQLIGNLAADPEIKNTQSGQKVANFRMACSEKWRDQRSGETREKTEWINVVVWNEGLVGVVERYVRKGSKLFVEGKFSTREWEKDGVKRYSTEVVLQGFSGQIVLLGEPRSGGDRQDDSSGYGRGAASQAPDRQTAARAQQAASRSATSYSHTALDDDIPFAPEFR